ncbi:MAG: hypothetical protein OEO19_08050 [Gammaproteobacteria bacterium]|nr:hypothetical protein [Gammaproteobacteria bacterium]MDH3449910.1 hypothetical protein [Gammaproteobacteria bacterium]
MKGSNIEIGDRPRDSAGGRLAPAATRGNKLDGNAFYPTRQLDGKQVCLEPIGLDPWQ